MRNGLTNDEIATIGNFIEMMKPYAEQIRDAESKLHEAIRKAEINRSEKKL